MSDANPIHYLQTKLDEERLLSEGLRKMNGELILGLINSQQEVERLKKRISQLSSR